MEEKTFEIDFIELAFLIEACIPPRPIARSMFWDRVINEYYYQFTDGQRKKLFHWIQLNPGFDTEKEGCLLFYDRFNPENQYTVVTNHDGDVRVNETFLHNGNYHTRKDAYIAEEFIIDVKPKKASL